MQRWDELERLGKLRSEGLLSDGEFQAEKRRILGADTAAPASIVIPDLAYRGPGPAPRWTWLVVASGAAMLAILLFWFFTRPPVPGPGSSGTDTGRQAAAPIQGPSEPAGYALRSNVTGASLVRLDRLPSATPYGGNSDDYCGERLRPATAAGRMAERQGWRVLKEAGFQGLNAILIVRGFDPGTSGHCFSKDPNLAFFDGEQLIGVLYSKGEDGIRMNDFELVGDHLRVWDDLSPVGQLKLKGKALTFDRVTGRDAVCNGLYRVPTVFGEPYSKARRLLGGAGWYPGPDPEARSEDARTNEYRGRFREVESCSGTGYALCSFGLASRDRVARLVITTAGEGEDPAVIRYDVACDGRDRE